jgi:hypothetical protein
MKHTLKTRAGKARYALRKQTMPFPVDYSRPTQCGQRSSRFDRRLRPKRLDHIFPRFQVRPADQVEAVGYGGEDAVQGFLDGFGLAGQVEDQAVSTHDANLAREDGGGDVFQADRAHLFAEARQHFVGNGEGGFRGDVARVGAGAPGFDS